MTKIEIIGNLGEDAKVKEFGEDKKKYVVLSVAVTEKNKDNDKFTTWWSVLSRGDGGKMLQYLKKGSKIYLRGEPKISLYKTKNGEHEISHGMYASEMHLCGSSAAKADDEAKNVKSSSADDLPF